MHVSVKPIMGMAVGFEIIEAKYIPDFDDDGIYLVFELLLFRIVISL
jgi:hypothetical protein